MRAHTHGGGAHRQRTNIMWSSNTCTVGRPSTASLTSSAFAMDIQDDCRLINDIKKTLIFVNVGVERKIAMLNHRQYRFCILYCGNVSSQPVSFFFFSRVAGPQSSRRRPQFQADACNGVGQHRLSRRHEDWHDGQWWCQWRGQRLLRADWINRVRWKCLGLCMYEHNQYYELTSVPNVLSVGCLYLINDDKFTSSLCSLSGFIANKSTYQLSGWPTDWLTDWHTDWLTDWLIDWLTDWLIEWLTQWPIEYPTEWVIDHRTNDHVNERTKTRFYLSTVNLSNQYPS